MSSWRKSSACNGASACVEVQTLPDGSVLMRDGKDPDGPVLTFTYGEWCAFVAGVVAGEFDPDVLAGSAAGRSGPGRAPVSAVAREKPVRLHG
jgi:hypothetical protein